MTLDDMLAREAIRDLMARYTTAGDRLRIDDFLACFTDDAVIESERVAPDRLFRHDGKAAIRAWQQRWIDGGEATHGATFVRHHLSTSAVTLHDGERAGARTYWTAWTDIGPDHAGYYLDSLRKVDGLWLIAHRRIRLDWESPDSLFRAAVANSGS